MTHDEIQEKVIKVVCIYHGYNSDELTCDTTLDDLDLDSLDRVEIVMEFEEEFSIDLEDDALENVNTIGQMVELIEKEL